MSKKPWISMLRYLVQRGSQLAMANGAGRTALAIIDDPEIDELFRKIERQLMPIANSAHSNLKHCILCSRLVNPAYHFQPCDHKAEFVCVNCGPLLLHCITCNESQPTTSLRKRSPSFSKSNSSLYDKPTQLEPERGQRASHGLDTGDDLSRLDPEVFSNNFGTLSLATDDESDVNLALLV